jgi:ABC-type polysaccharide/polyol phosphate export permease
VLLQLLLVLWVSLLLASLYVFVKDIEHVYQVFLRVLFLVTPTFYAPDLLGSGAARLVVLLNPLAQLIGYSRAILIGEVPLPYGVLAALFAANLLLILAALTVFRRLEPRFAENV